MISKLFIENLILIEKCAIDLGPHLTILTGETGSGKSVVLNALGLIAGGRADLDTIGKWSDQTIVSAEVDSHLIRREIHRSGKSRCWIDETPVTLSLLKDFVGSKIERVDQNSSQTLCSPEVQRKKIDLFGGLLPDSTLFADSFQKEELLREKMAQMQQRQRDYQRDLAWAETSLDSIREVDWKEGEEESLSQEHKRLCHIQELTTSVGQIASTLAEHSSLKTLAHQLQGCLRFDSKLEMIATTLKNCALEVDETERQLRSYLDRLEPDPSQLTTIESRMGAIETLKKRFGGTREEVEKKRASFESLIQSQSEIGQEISLLELQLKELEEKNRLLADLLSQKRKSAAIRFSEAVVHELKTLNLPHAQFFAKITPKPLSSSGLDAVQFLFSANPGHEPLPVEQCASGGELSRLFFAIQITLAEKEKTGSLVFDEIDSNIGGHTASILGEKLRCLSLYRQVICVTHFAQVARFATDHFLVSKEEASVQITPLGKREREKEYLRMQGNLK